MVSAVIILPIDSAGKQFRAELPEGTVLILPIFVQLDTLGALVHSCSSCFPGLYRVVVLSCYCHHCLLLYLRHCTVFYCLATRLISTTIARSLTAWGNGVPFPGRRTHHTCPVYRRGPPLSGLWPPEGAMERAALGVLIRPSPVVTTIALVTFLGLRSARGHAQSV